jgi:hypothetical protein
MLVRGRVLLFSVVGALVLVAAAGALATSACSSSSPAAAACNENPWQCGTGQTCWPQGCNCPSGWSFACIASAAGVPLGESCSLEIGKATCGEMQTCVFLQGADHGACRAYCDPSNPDRGCGPGQECAQLVVGDASPARLENVCVPMPVDEDASLTIEAGTGSSSGGGAYGDAIVQPDAKAEAGHPQQ